MVVGWWDHLPMDLGLWVRGGLLEDGVLQSLGSARAGLWLLFKKNIIY